jgi:hypothetical protein
MMNSKIIVLVAAIASLLFKAMITPLPPQMGYPHYEQVSTANTGECTPSSTL